MTETENVEDALTYQEMVEIDEVIADIDKGETISLEDLKEMMKE